MIYSKNILAGYVILRGTALIHIPMLLIMLAVPRIDDKDEWRFGIPIPATDNTSFDAGTTWYLVCIMQHILLSLLHLNTMISFEEFKTGSITPMAVEGFKMLTILA